MSKFKEYFDHALKAFESGLHGVTPPAASPETAKILAAVRDAILSIVELVLTVAAIFVYVLTTSALFKILLIIAILISGLRTYVTASRFWDIVSGPAKPLPPENS